MMTLGEVAAEISRRLSRIFLRDDDGRRPVFGDVDALPAGSALARLRALPRVLPRRHRRGVGASHQTGWTGLVAKLLQQSGE